MRKLIFLGCLATLAGCNTDMWRQPVTNPLDAASPGLFPDGAAARPLLPNTIPAGHLRTDQAFFTGVEDGAYVRKNPLRITIDVLRRGQERFNAICTPCHGRLGNGKGMIAQRGLTLARPVGSFHDAGDREMPDGWYYDVITNGNGVMYSYASRVTPPDRWAIVAYIRALQLSQSAPASMANAEALEASTHLLPPAETPSSTEAHSP